MAMSSAAVLSPILGTVNRFSSSAEKGRYSIGTLSPAQFPASSGCAASSSAPSLLLKSRSRSASRPQKKIKSLVVFAAENENSSSSSSGETGTTEADVEALEARIGVGRRARRQQELGQGQGGRSDSSKSAKSKPAAKSRDSMTMLEKAWSIYIDPEKGILFWLNKLAYGAIFAIIGGWIVFRFIGPALGWYELDQPLLSPDRLLDGAP